MAGHVLSILAGIAELLGLAIDPGYTLYTIGHDTGTLSSIDLLGTVRPVIELGADERAWYGPAVDPAGNIYVSQTSAGEVRKVTPHGEVTAFASGLSQPRGLTTDSEGNVYVSCFDVGKIFKLTPNIHQQSAGKAGPGVVQASATEYASGLSGPDALAFNNQGELFVANRANNQIRKISVGSGQPEIFVQLDHAPEALVSMPNGHLIVATRSALLRVNSDGQTFDLGTGFSLVSGLAADPEGNLLVADVGNGVVYKATVRDSEVTGRVPAEVRFYCLALRVLPATATVDGDTYAAEVTGGVEDDPVNDELAPMFYPDSPMSKPDPDDFTHICEMRISVADVPEPLIVGELMVNVPEPSDANDNGYPDFFEVDQAVSPVVTEGWFLGLEDIPVQLTWQRAAQASRGTVQVQMELLGLGELAFETSFELLEYAGTLDYVPGQLQATGTVQLMESGPQGRTVTGRVVLTKDSANSDTLQLNEGTWTFRGGDEWRCLESPIWWQSASNFFGLIDLEDGDSSTDLEDYLTWVLSIDDPNDTDEDTIVDLLDEPGEPPPAHPPALSIQLSGMTLFISISGESGRGFVLEDSPSLVAPAWTESRSGVLTDDATTVNIPLTVDRQKFFRVRILE